MTWVDRICTYEPDKGKQKRHIAEDRKDNGYPSQHLDRNWCTTSNPRQLRSPEDPPRAAVVIPYIRHLSEYIQCILALLKFHTCFWPHCTLRHMLVNLRNNTPCNPTGRSDLPKGVCWPYRENTEPQTEGAQRCPDKWNLTQSVMAEHTAAHNHTIDWRSAKVGDTHHQFQQRCLLEYWYIRSQDAIRNRCITNWLSRQVTVTLPKDAATVELLSWTFHSPPHVLIIILFKYYKFFFYLFSFLTVLSIFICAYDDYRNGHPRQIGAGARWIQEWASDKNDHRLLVLQHESMRKNTRGRIRKFPCK